MIWVAFIALGLVVWGQWLRLNQLAARLDQRRQPTRDGGPDLIDMFKEAP